MFESLFNKEEQIKEPENEAETKTKIASEADHETGVVQTQREADEERKKNFEDPTRFRDLR